MKLKPILTFSFFLLFAATSFSQMKVVIMGSSTAFGTGASTYENSWAGRLENYLNRNAGDGVDTTVYNIANSGYDSYQLMPDDFVPPAGRPQPDDSYNVTKALSYQPNVVIISLPSNDISYGYAKYETMFNFRLMSSRFVTQGIRCYFTTPQPRNDFDLSQRDSLVSMIDSVNSTFGPLAINFWDGLVSDDGLYSLRDEFRSNNSPIHLNDAGHEILFQAVLNSVFDFAGPVALQLTGFQVRLQNNQAAVTWHTEQQEPNTNFEVERSTDGRIFQSILFQNVSEARQAYDYVMTDQRPLPGKSFYRLKITHAGRQSYSNVVTVSNQTRSLDVTKIFVENGSTLVAEISVDKNQFVNAVVVATNGSILQRQKINLSAGSSSTRIGIDRLPTGQYFLKISGQDGSAVVKAFTK